MSEVQETKKQVKVSDVLAMLRAGQTREEIAAHYDLTMAEAKRDIFSHEKIKNKKTHKPSRVTLIDDVAEVEMVDDTATVADTTSTDAVTTEEVGDSNLAERVASVEETANQEEMHHTDGPGEQAPATEEKAEGSATPAAGSW